jgi:hypothetical protein
MPFLSDYYTNSRTDRIARNDSQQFKDFLTVVFFFSGVVAFFFLNDSKRSALQLPFTLYAVRLNSFSFWLCVCEIPTPTTERKFFDLKFGRIEFIYL